MKNLTNEFIRKSREIHGEKFDYDRTEYVRSDIKLVVTCKVHGDFQITPNNHLKGIGCRQCKLQNQRMSLEEWISRANKAHSNKYSYDSVDYVSGKKKVVIVCPDHGRFEQRAKEHLKGVGCPSCANRLGDHLTGYLYILKVAGEDTFTGYGITNNPKRRISEHRKTFKPEGYFIEDYCVISGKGSIIFQIEKEMKNVLPKFATSLKGFVTESTIVSYDEVKRFVNNLMKENNNS